MHKGILHDLAVGFHETLTGQVRAASWPAARSIEVQASVELDDLGEFLRTPNSQGRLQGIVNISEVGVNMLLEHGTFTLLESKTPAGTQCVCYQAQVRTADGTRYRLEISKHLGDEPSVKVRLYEHDTDRVFADGELRLDLGDLQELLESMRLKGSRSSWQQTAARRAVAWLVAGALRSKHTEAPIVYETRYQNLVVSGVMRRADGHETSLFLVAGMYDRGFPTGDCQMLWDVLLAIGDGAGGYRCYAMADRWLEGLRLDVSRGTMRYSGPLVALEHGYATSVSELRQGVLPTLQASLSVRFASRAFETIVHPFELGTGGVRVLSSIGELAHEKLRLGIELNALRIEPTEGSLEISALDGSALEHWQLVGPRCVGEAERSSVRDVRRPATLYDSLCAVYPLARASHLQVHTRTWRPHDAQQDRLEAWSGTIVARTVSTELHIDDSGLHASVLRANDKEEPALHAFWNLGKPAPELAKGAPRFIQVGEPLVQVIDDQVPTALVLRRIVKVRDPQGVVTLAFEQGVSMLRCEPIGTDREVTVAVMRNEDKFEALEAALQVTAFDQVLEQARARSGKAKTDFAIVIKPNFMFACSNGDGSTYTDAEMVAHLAKRIRALGYTKVKVVEAQSANGEHAGHRSVAKMAQRLGFRRDELYELVDLAEEARAGGGKPSTSWCEADFRISFAKNKTHAHAFYSLALKNVFGTRPPADDASPIEHVARYPVHFALIDAHLSADGPFGILADPSPNPTHTVLASADVIAVDWLAASKMGLDPMISPHMREAVERLGKPRIRVVGDAGVYWPWRNVPMSLSLFTGRGLDASYRFGNLLQWAVAGANDSLPAHRGRRQVTAAKRRKALPPRRF